MIDESDSSLEETKEAPSWWLSGNNYLPQKTTGKALIDEDKDFKQESKRVSYDGPQIKSLQSYKSKSESIH